MLTALELKSSQRLAELSSSRAKAVDFLLSQLQEDGSIGPDEGRAYYYRVPWAFAVCGETAAAMSTLEWIKRHALTADGEIAAPNGRGRPTFNTYSETNVAYGAQLLRRYDVAQATMRFALRSQDPETGGAYFDREQTGPDGPQLLFPTAQLGMSALLTGHVAAAIAAGHWFQRLWDAQPELPQRLYTMQTRAGGLATQVPSDGVRTHYINEANEVRQYHYNGGIAAAFLARLYMHTAEPAWLSLSRAFQRFSMESTERQFETKQVCKSAWGAGLLTMLTGEATYRDWTARMGEWFVAEQEADGSWVNTQYLSPNPSMGDRIEITAEFIVHLDTIIGALASAAVQGDQP